MRFYYVSIRISKIKIVLNIIEDVQLKLSFTVDRNVKYYSNFDNRLVVS